MEEEGGTVKRTGVGGLPRVFVRSSFRSYAQKKAAAEKPTDETLGLDLSVQGLRVFSPKILDWTSLVTLSLAYNSISEIPPEISRLSGLSVLDLSHNRIRKVPRELGRLCSLRELGLAGNLLSSVPPEFGSLYQMEKLDLDGNPLVGQIGHVYSTSGGLGVVRYYRDNVSLSFPYWEREWIFNGQEEGTANANSHTNSHTISHAGAGSGANTVTVATYNILCPSSASSQTYAYVPTWALQWETRKAAILQEATSYGADILCVQEMDTTSYIDYFRDQFKIRGGYESVFYQKPRAKSAQEYERRSIDGCAVFWKSMTFQLVEQKFITLSQLFGPKASPPQADHVFSRFASRDNIAVVVVLERGGSHIVVANTHIYWDPEFPDVKTLQGLMLLKEVEGLMQRYPSAELVVCGDFNSLPSSSLHELYSTGSLKPNCKDLLGLEYEPYSSRGYSHGLQLRSSYSFVNMGFTNYTPGFMGVIDYIWHNEMLAPVCSLGPVDEEYAAKIVGLPTHHYPSDHLILVTQFRCRQPPHWRGGGNK